MRGLLFFLIAATRLEAQNNPLSLNAASPQSINGDFWVGTEVGPYMLQTHNGTIYPETPFILVPRKLKPAREKILRAAIARTFSTDFFNDAPVFVAIDFYVKVLKKHPDQEEFVKGEYVKTDLFLKKKKSIAIAFRLAKDRTEGSLR